MTTISSIMSRLGLALRIGALTVPCDDRNGVADYERHNQGLPTID